MAIKFCVFTAGNTTDGYSPKPIAGAVPESTHADFDTAYEAAQAAGGDRVVVSIYGSGRYGDSEYVPATAR